VGWFHDFPDILSRRLSGSRRTTRHSLNLLTDVLSSRHRKGNFANTSSAARRHLQSKRFYSGSRFSPFFGRPLLGASFCSANFPIGFSRRYGR